MVGSGDASGGTPEIGIGLDGTLGLTLADEAALAAEAARLDYRSIWTPSTGALDPLQLCAYRWAASRAATPGRAGLGTGIGVLPLQSPGMAPAQLVNPVELANRVRSISAVTGGRFILGIGTGGIYRDPSAAAGSGAGESGGKPVSTLGLVRDYLLVLRGLLAGDTVTHQGQVWQIANARLAPVPLGGDPASDAATLRTPVYLAALGPEMLRLTGEHADGVALNWCSAEQHAWSRERIAEGAQRAGRALSDVRIMDYIRVCIDDDVDAARRAFARVTARYAAGIDAPTPRGRRMGYRAHFERMGFTDALAQVDDLRARGATEDEMAATIPDDLLLRVGYFGTAAGAPAAIRRLAAGLDEAIVRIVPARTGPDATLAAMRACRPELLLG